MAKSLSRQAKKHKEEAARPEKKPVVKVSPPTPVTPPAPPPVVQEPEPAPPPVAEPEKPKKARFVRQQQEKRPRAKAAPLPAPSKKQGGKLMTKNLALPPKEDRPGRPKA